MKPGTMKLVLIQLIFCMLLSLFTLNIRAAEYDKIGVEAGNKYEWTLSDVDPEVMEDLTRDYEAEWRDNSKLVIEIEEVVEEDNDDFNNSWYLEVDYWDFEQEVDDDGNDQGMRITDDVEDFVEDALVDFIDDRLNLDDLPDELLFIPQDVEDFLTEADEDIGWPDDGDIVADGKELEFEYNETNAVFKYSNDGILEELVAKWDGDTAYKLTLTSSGPAGAISFGFVFIIILAPSVIALIVIVRKKLIFSK
ncbi:MAG: hypothetical protein EU544_02195 [Promethearchaeota archaeon]|nr:MAG: hypothetical protein EU544_02195 [Candidatus Lokiarchaeota archaeon]